MTRHLGLLLWVLAVVLVIGGVVVGLLWWQQRGMSQQRGSAWRSIAATHCSIHHGLVMPDIGDELYK